MSNLIIEYQYFGSVNYINTLFKFKHIDFEVCETYQKMSFRNRCSVVGSNGIVNLSVPLMKGRDQKAPIKEIRISYDQPWQVQQWRTIVSCYNRSPYFEYYAPWLESFFQRQHSFLLDLNCELTDWLWKVLKMEALRDETKNYVALHDPFSGVVDMRSKLTPASLSNYLLYSSYHQVFEDRLGFIPNMSILDLLFCEGPAAISILQAAPESGN